MPSVHGLQGKYQPNTDHIRFNQRIPDEFPFIDYEVHDRSDLTGLAMLIDEFIHRCQWAATPIGLVFRMAALAQIKESLEVARKLAANQSLILPAPWLDFQQSTVDQSLLEHLHIIRSLDLLQRLLLGVPLGCPASELRKAIQLSRESLTRLTPLSFANFESWDAENVAYRPDGMPIHMRTTRAILESHASAYAVELLRGCSPGADPAWFQDHVAQNEGSLYSALQELARTTTLDLPSLATRHILELADLAISGQVADIHGFPPPPDYIDSMLPYTRYDNALRDVASSADALNLMEQHQGRSIVDDDVQRLDLIVRNAALTGGEASPLLGLPVLPRRPSMDRNIATTLAWASEQRRALEADNATRVLDEILINAFTYYTTRFFVVHAEMKTDSVLFQPTVERFILLTRLTDWPVIEYADGLEVFLCNPMKEDPQPVVASQITIFELATITQRLMRQQCSVEDIRRWHLSIYQAPFTEVLGNDPEQLTTQVT